MTPAQVTVAKKVHFNIFQFLGHFINTQNKFGDTDLCAHGILRHVSVVALGMVRWSVHYFDPDYQMDCHEIWYTHSCPPQDELQQFW